MVSTHSARSAARAAASDQCPFYPQPYLELLNTTFCMTTHQRLDSHSIWADIPHIIVQIIIQWVWYNP